MVFESFQAQKCAENINSNSSCYAVVARRENEKMTRTHDNLFSLNANVSLVTGTPDDIVGTIVYLVSAASDYLTGRIIFRDGGWMAS